MRNNQHPFLAIVLNPRFFFVNEQYYQIMELSSKHIRSKYPSGIMLDEEDKLSLQKMNRDIYSLIELEKASEFDHSYYWPSFGSILNWTSTKRSSPSSSSTPTTKHRRARKVQSDDAQSETSSFISNSSSSILSH